MSVGTRRLSVRAVPGLPDLRAGDDLAALVVAVIATEPPDDLDVLCVSSKAVAKVEGRTVHARREDVVDDEADRDVARRGPLRVVRTRHGLVLAAAGVDASNTEVGTVVPLPVDPDASARRLRASLLERTGRNVAVVVTDTAGRAWRTGQTEIAVGCAGLVPVHDLAGEPDGYGRPLEVTAPAVADQVADAAGLVLGKAAKTPVAVVSGLAEGVLAPGEHGPGAVALVRPEQEDLFGLGSADAVRAAVRRGPGDRRGFAPSTQELPVLAHGWLALARAGPAPDQVEMDQRAALDGGVRLVVRTARRHREDPAAQQAAGAVAERLRVLAWADGWRLEPAAGRNGDEGALVLTPSPLP